MRHVARGLFDAAGAGHTILAPNAELAAALFDAVERTHVDAGDEVWPTPRVRDFGSWLRERQAQRQLADASLPRVLNDIEERELWRAAVQDGGMAADQFLEPAGAARAARRARRAMAEYGITAQALTEYGTEETLALLAWDRRFEERCRDLHGIAAHRLLEVAPDGATPSPSGLVWAESPIWRPVVRRWLLRAGAVPLSAAQAGAAPARPPRLLRSESPDAELAAVAEWAAEGLAADAQFRAWICLPDLAGRRAAAGDAFDAALAPQRFSLLARDALAPYALAGGTPLADYAPVRSALDALIAAAGETSFDSFSALLRRPELAATAADASAAALLDVQLRRRGPHAADLNHWLDLAERAPGPLSAVQRLRAFTRTLESVRGGHRMSRWVSLWVTAFEAGPWASRARWSSTEYQAAERFRELLGELATADALFGALSAAAAAGLLQRAARETAFQVQTGIPPIWVSGTVMDPWLVYDGLWLAGCGEDRWPPPLDPVPLLPVRLQRAHGILPAGADAQLELAADLQRRWRLRAPAIVYSCADAPAGRAARFGSMLAAEAAQPALMAHARPHPHWHAVRAGAPQFDSVVDEQAPAFAAPERLHGIAALRAQSRCPFRGFAATRLLAEPLDKPVPGFNPRERGEMLHHALEQVWNTLASWARLTALAPAALAELTSVAVERAVAEQCAHRDPGAHWRRREVPRLQALLLKWLDTERLRAPFEVERLESAEVAARFGGLEFSVRIDRMDRLDDGARVLLDYKTGMAATDWRGARPDNPQLPIYALLYPAGLVAVAYGKVNAGDCGFIAETARGNIFGPRSRASKLEGMTDFPALIALWSTRIEAIAAEFAAGFAAVTPKPQACAACGLQPLCRIPSVLDDD